MKKQFLGTLSILSFLLMLTAATASAQSARSKAINIPFNFIAGQKTLPAGEYTVEPNRKDFDKVWLIQGRDGQASVLVMTMPAPANNTQESAKLVFHKYGDQYFLSQIWTPGGDTGRELLMPRLERQLAKNTIERQMIVLASGPASKN